MRRRINLNLERVISVLLLCVFQFHYFSGMAQDSDSLIVGTDSHDSMGDVELKALKGVNDGGEAVISWVTLREHDNDRFEIHRLEGEDQWRKIGELKGYDRSEIARYYSWTDQGSTSGTQYYKLTQFDEKGNVKEFGPIPITIDPNIGINLLPNPFEGRLKLHIRGEVNWQIGLSVYDASGMMVHSTTFIPGDPTYLINLQHLDQGTYQCVVELDGYSITKEVMKKGPSSYLTGIDRNRLREKIRQTERVTSSEIILAVTNDHPLALDDGNAALFEQYALYRTCGRNALLIMFDAQSEQLVYHADEGVLNHVPEERLNALFAELNESLDPDLDAELEEAIEKSGALLAEYFPGNMEGTNELPNHVVY